MVFRPGPVFTTCCSPTKSTAAAPKTQSALIESDGRAARHRRGKDHQLDDPFLVVARESMNRGHVSAARANLDSLHDGRLHSPTRRRSRKRKSFYARREGRRKCPEEELRPAPVPAMRDLVLAVTRAERRSGDIAVPIYVARAGRRQTRGRSVNDIVSWGAGRVAHRISVAAKAPPRVAQGRTAHRSKTFERALPILRHRLFANHRAGETV